MSFLKSLCRFCILIFSLSTNVSFSDINTDIENICKSVVLLTTATNCESKDKHIIVMNLNVEYCNEFSSLVSSNTDSFNGNGWDLILNKNGKTKTCKIR